MAQERRSPWLRHTGLALCLISLLSASCALGNAAWRDESRYAVLSWPGAGDGRCSHPAPYPSLEACLVHDAAYELARRAQCEGWEPDLYSEQARLVADLVLATQMAQDGLPEFWVRVYFQAVRLGAWRSWYLPDCGD